MKQERVEKSKVPSHRVEEPEAKPLSKSQTRRLAIQQNEQNSKKVKEDLDEILDEIDELLESNAEEFVKSYIQKGGE